MASSSTYDEKLLSQAPEVTKADLQDGYNADLLREPTVKRASTTRSPPARSNSVTLQQQYHSHNKDLESSAVPKESPKYVESRKPWWRTVKGIAIIAAVAIVIVIVAVLGGVLGSQRKSNNTFPSGATNGDSVPLSPTSSTSSASSPSSTPSGTPVSGGSQVAGTGGASSSNSGQTAGGVTGSANGDDPIVSGGNHSGNGNGPPERRAEEVMLRALGLHP